MTALQDDELDPKPYPGWHLPVRMTDFLDVLRRTPSLGTTDADRVHAFARLPAWQNAPPGLIADLKDAGLLLG